MSSPSHEVLPTSSVAQQKLREKKLKKHVAAIHTDGQLSLLQRKLSNVLLLNAYDHLLTRPEHEIDEKTLCVMLGYDSNDRAPLKAALKALASVQTEWDILDDGGSEVEWGIASLLSHAVLSRGMCRYGYAPTLAEKLYNPAIYASINMKVQRRFRSGHALALYENCYRFKDVGSTGWWDIHLFRRLLGVGESDYYKAFKHLNAKIIKPITKEINQSSDIHIIPEFKKRGRSVAEIRFLIKPNSQLPLMDIDDDDGVKTSLVYKRLMAISISHKLAQQWIVTYGEDYVRDKLDYAHGQKTQGRIRGSLSGFVNAAVIQDYNTDVMVAKKQQKVVELGKEKETRLAAQINAERRAEKLALIDRAEQGRAWLAAQSKEDRPEILAQFEASLVKNFAKADFKKSGLESAHIAMLFANFVSENDVEI